MNKIKKILRDYWIEAFYVVLGFATHHTYWFWAAGFLFTYWQIRERVPGLKDWPNDGRDRLARWIRKKLWKSQQRRMVKVTEQRSPDLLLYPTLVYLEVGEAREVFIQEGFSALMQNMEAMWEGIIKKFLSGMMDDSIPNFGEDSDEDGIHLDSWSPESLDHASAALDDPSNWDQDGNFKLNLD
jgi:hypothetical protein